MQCWRQAARMTSACIPKFADLPQFGDYSLRNWLLLGKHNKNLLKILMDCVRARVGFEKERSCTSNSPSQVLSHHHWYSRWGILLISAWLKCGIGNSTSHRLRWWEKNHCFAIQACFDHSIRILLVLQQFLIRGLKGEGEQFLPLQQQLLESHLYSKGWCHFLWSIQLFPQFKYSLLSCITHTHTDFCFASARLKLHKPDAESSSRFSFYLEKTTFFIANPTLVLESSTRFCSCYC